jgi:hypothetical protein
VLTGIATSLAPAATGGDSFSAGLGTLAVVLLASAGAGALAFPLSRLLGFPAIFRPARRTDPHLAASTLVACASLIHKKGFNVAASATSDPLLSRAVALAASEAGVDEVLQELTMDIPVAPRPIIAWAPVLGLCVALAGLWVVVWAASLGLISGAGAGVGLVAALYGAFLLSTAAGAGDDPAHRLSPSDVLTRAIIAAAVPAIRAGADSAAVEQILRPMLNPRTVETPVGRMAA